MYAIGVIYFELCWIVRRHERDKVSRMLSTLSGDHVA